MNIHNDNRFIVDIQEIPINVQELIEKMKANQAGALSVFLGN